MDELWSQLTRGEPTLRWFGRQPQGSAIAGGVLHSPRALGRLVQNLRPSWDLYFNVNRSSRLGGVRICAADITHWTTVLLDIDPTDGLASPPDAARAYLERAFEVLGYEVPTLVVDSGRGVQVHLRLTPMKLADANERAHVRDAVGAFLREVAGPTPLYGCKLDLSCSDLARVARMPLTINHKTGEKTAVLNDSRTVPSKCGGTMEANRRILALAGVASHRVDKHPITDGLKYQQVWSRLTATAQRFIQEGALSPGRHVACVATVRSLRDNGVPQSEVERLVLGASGRCTPPLELSEASRIIHASYR